MKKAWNKASTSSEWLCIKVLFILYWLGAVIGISLKYTSTPVPQGVFTFFHLADYTLTWLNPIVIALAIILAIAYLFEYKMPYTTLVLFIVSVFLFTLQESNGILSRSGLISFIFFAQFLAYATSSINNEAKAYSKQINFSIQAIAATYTLSALSKLITSGFAWINQGKFMSLQIIKSHQYSYVTTGNYAKTITGNIMANFIQNHQSLVTFLMVTTLLLELFAWLSMRNKFNAFIYGLLLLCMHIAMSVIMGINLTSISIPMVIFMIVPGAFNLGFQKSLKQ